MAGTNERSLPDQTQPGPGGPLTPPAQAPLDQLFDADGLYSLRSAVAAHAADLGLSEQSVHDLVLVAHELATNAVRHGGATSGQPGLLRLWASHGAVVWQGHDPGPGRDDLNPVRHTPGDPGASNGRGMWILRRPGR